MARHTLTLIAACAALWPLAAGAKDFAESVPARSGGQLEIDLDAGSVLVEVHDAERVTVSAHAVGFRADSLDFDLESDGRDVRLSGNMGGWIRFLSDPRVRVTVRVPERYSLDVRTSGGSVEVEGVEGTVYARTSGGAVRAHEIEGRVELETSGGAIDVGEIEGDLRAETSGGPIRAVEIEGRVEVSTSGGPIRLHEVEGPVDARTSGGSISVWFEGEPEGYVETSGGGIEVEFSEGEGVSLDAQTSGGRVEIDPGFLVRGTLTPSEVKGEIEGGGRTLRLRTSGGNIRIRPR